MKTFLQYIAFLLLFPALANAQNGKVIDKQVVASKILKSDRLFSVYLPDGYDESVRSYPVLYLLHGLGGDQANWIEYGELQHIADEAIHSGKASPMIIVMPDATTGKSGYFNDLSGNWNYEDFFFQELIPFIEKNYRAKTIKRSRAIAGLSMGGGGTFMYALHHPEMFSAAYPISASVGPLTLESAKTRYNRNNESYPDSQIEAYYLKHNAVSLVDALADDQLNAVRWFIDCGDDDALDEGNIAVHLAMRRKGVPHEFRINDGGHTWTYWRTALPKVLEFVSHSFRGS